ncbi:MAG TPA: DUF4340 domain-containing protein [Verrucomicrobiota bacterium]|nr:DUF4340 domain-containing protein [Verrucomicrobiota bacterium]HQL77625.1 DUF4340 domain-containing protein [Verrucomicrobiota bacterium]
MNSWSTWRWLTVAVMLMGFIAFHHKYLRKTNHGPGKVLPALQAAAVTSVQVRPAASLEIRAERTNGTWQLVQPLIYPAQAVTIEKLLAGLEELIPAPYITARELRGRPKADEEFGFASPQASIILEQPGHTSRLRIGARTAPGDQVFLQVVGVEGVYVVDAGLLQFLPRTADDWRSTALLDLKGVTPDGLAVTNGAKIFELRCPATNRLWRMHYPLQARANNVKVEESLQMLQSISVSQFVPTDPKMDLETFGLHPPELELAISQGTNTVAWLQFGKSPTNDTRLVYARRVGLNAIVAVPKDLLAPWYGSVNDFREPFLITPTAPVAVVDVRAQDSFSLQQQTNGTWRVLPEDFPADAGLVKYLLSALNELQIVEFAQDVVVSADLPAYGLASPLRQYILRAATTNVPAGLTNPVIAELSFGTNQADRVFARRADESFVYAVKLADFQRLPAAGWQMRERRIWSISTNDVARVALRQQGRARQIVRNGPHSWSLAPGSPGVINDLAVEETVSGLCRLAATAWLARGETNRTRLGFTENNYQITLELKNGEKAVIEFGSDAPGNPPTAAVTLNGEPWVFEFPTWLYDYVQRYLPVPTN